MQLSSILVPLYVIVSIYRTPPFWLVYYVNSMFYQTPFSSASERFHFHESNSARYGIEPETS